MTGSTSGFLSPTPRFEIHGVVLRELREESGAYKVSLIDGFGRLREAGGLKLGLSLGLYNWCKHLEFVRRQNSGINSNSIKYSTVHKEPRITDLNASDCSEHTSSRIYLPSRYFTIQCN